jgi:hypothetical protein
VKVWLLGQRRPWRPPTRAEHERLDAEMTVDLNREADRVIERHALWIQP